MIILGIDLDDGVNALGIVICHANFDVFYGLFDIKNSMEDF